MKRTLDVNIGGFVFHLDEDAFNMLERYLESLKKHYRNTEGGEEIISDIENRIAELLHERKPGSGAVIELDDISDIINILGDPEQIFEEEEPKVSYKVSKKLYRDADNRVFGGVAAGLAAYLGLPIALVRILIIILAFPSLGVGILIYFIFWIVVPKAITAKQKLEMKGDPINISNIERKIKDEYSEVKESLKKKGPTVKKNISTFWERVESLFSGIGRVIVILIGCFLIFVSTISLLSIIASLFITNWVIIPFSDLHLYNIVPELLMNTSNSLLFIISLFLFCGIPFILLLYAGLKMVVRFKNNSSLLPISLVCLWIFSIVNLGILATHQLKHYKGKAINYSEVETIEPTSKNTVYIKCLSDNWRKERNDIYMGNIRLTNRDGKTVMLGRAGLDFERSESDKFEITLKKQSRGKDDELAYENIKRIEYKWEFKDSVIYLNNYFTIKDKQLWRAQDLEVVIKVPEGKNIVLDEMIERKLDINTFDFYNFYGEKRNTNTWTMSSKGELEAVK